MKRHRRLFVLVVLGGSTLLTTAATSSRGLAAQSRPTDQPSTLTVRDSGMDAARRQRVVDSLLVQLEREYVFPGKVPALAASLRQRLQRGDYDNISNAVAFADTLTAHIRQVIADRHLSVRFLPARRAPVTRDASTGASSTTARRPSTAWVERVEVLPSNIGYLALSGFADRADAETPYRDAMTKLADTDFLIIDIRDNRGGHPEGVALLISYLVGTDSIHLNSFHFRNGDSTLQTWTSPLVTGRKFGPDKPVYVLTSSTTFSAAEEFAYDLQAIRRGTIIGEVTGGGANPGQVARLDANMAAFIPFAEARNPITGTNWEGVGVKPEIEVPAAVALDRALEEIARKRRR